MLGRAREICEREEDRRGSSGNIGHACGKHESIHGAALAPRVNPLSFLVCIRQDYKNKVEVKFLFLFICIRQVHSFLKYGLFYYKDSDQRPLEASE